MVFLHMATLTKRPYNNNRLKSRPHLCGELRPVMKTSTMPRSLYRSLFAIKTCIVYLFIRSLSPDLCLSTKTINGYSLTESNAPYSLSLSLSFRERSDRKHRAVGNDLMHSVNVSCSQLSLSKQDCLTTVAFGCAHLFPPGFRE